MSLARRILVSGRVQGVFYRDSCRKQAERLGVAGSARNLDDGRVEVIASGPDEAVSELIEWCRKGPPQASVDSVEVAELDASSTPDGGFRTD